MGLAPGPCGNQTDRDSRGAVHHNMEDNGEPVIAEPNKDEQLDYGYGGCSILNLNPNPKGI